jgi:hypothetical protein
MTLLVSQLAFGCARVRDGLERKTSIEILKLAYELGIRHYDTAPMYGASESLVGEVLGSYKDAVLATKVGLPRGDESVSASMKSQIFAAIKLVAKPLHRSVFGSSWSGRRVVSQLRVGEFESSTLRWQVEKSAERLCRQKIDLLLLHEPPSQGVSTDFLTELKFLTAEGLVGRYGVGTGSSYQLMPSIGSAMQCIFWGISREFLQTPNLILLHGFARGFDDGLALKTRHLIKSSDVLNALDSLANNNEDLLNILIGISLTAGNNIRAVYSTLSKKRLIRLVWVLSKMDELYASMLYVPRLESMNVMYSISNTGSGSNNLGASNS